MCHVYCAVCKEHLGEIEPLEEGIAIECICPECRRTLIQQAKLDDKPMRKIGFVKEPEEPSK